MGGRRHRSKRTRPFPPRWHEGTALSSALVRVPVPTSCYRVASPQRRSEVHRVPVHRQRTDGAHRGAGQAPRIRVPGVRHLRRHQRLLGLRAARRAAQEQPARRLVARHGRVPAARPRRFAAVDRRHRLVDRPAPEGLGGERPRRRLLRPDGRLPRDEGPLPGRPPARPAAEARPRPAGLLRLHGGRTGPGAADGAQGDARPAAPGRLRVAAAGRPRRVGARPRLGARRLGSRHADRGPRLQPDVQDLPRRRLRRGERRLSAARDRPGHLPELQGRAGHVARAAALRHRPDRQGLSQRG